MGGGHVKVDLTEDDYDVIVDEALSALGTYFPRERLGVVHFVNGQSKYQLDDGTYGRGIIDIKRPFQTWPFYTLWPLPEPYVVSIPLMHLGDYALSYTSWKSAAHLTGANLRWSFDKDTGILMISPAEMSSGNYAYVYLDDPTLDEVRGRSKWVKEYALAMAKAVAGAKYKKIKGFPGTEYNVQLAEEWADEGTERMRELEEEIKQAGLNRVPPRPAYMG